MLSMAHPLGPRFGGPNTCILLTRVEEALGLGMDVAGAIQYSILRVYSAGPMYSCTWMGLYVGYCMITENDEPPNTQKE